MNVRHELEILLILLTATLFLSTPSSTSAQIELEVDPIAYVSNGFSLHLAKVLGPVRINVGTFGIDVPRWVHGNEGWDETMRGAGVKVDYLGARLDGFFVGIDGAYMRNRYVLSASGETEARDIMGLGVRGGYRLSLGGGGLYLAPWLGVSYNFSGDDVTIGPARFERSAIVLFPTVHLGWRF